MNSCFDLFGLVQPLSEFEFYIPEFKDCIYDYLMHHHLGKETIAFLSSLCPVYKGTKCPHKDNASHF